MSFLRYIYKSPTIHLIFRKRLLYALNYTHIQDFPLKCNTPKKIGHLMGYDKQKCEENFSYK
jgi:hypothetical protein